MHTYWYHKIFKSMHDFSKIHINTHVFTKEMILQGAPLMSFCDLSVLIPLRCVHEKRIHTKQYRYRLEAPRIGSQS